MVHKNAAYRADICQQLAKCNIVNSGFEKKFLGAGEGLKGNGFVCSKVDLFDVLQSKLQLAWTARDFTLCSDYCYLNAQWDCPANWRHFFESTSRSIRQTLMSSSKRSVTWKDCNAKIQ